MRALFRLGGEYLKRTVLDANDLCVCLPVWVLIGWWVGRKGATAVFTENGRSKNHKKIKHEKAQTVDTFNSFQHSLPLQGLTGGPTTAPGRVTHKPVIRVFDSEADRQQTLSARSRELRNCQRTTPAQAHKPGLKGTVFGDFVPHLGAFRLSENSLQQDRVAQHWQNFQVSVKKWSLKWSFALLVSSETE